MKRTAISFIAVLAMLFGICGTSNHASAQTDKEKIYEDVDKRPEYPGGFEVMYQFIAAHLGYPEEARENALEGKVYISFVVEKDGSLTDIKITKDIGGGCGEAAVAVVKMMPKWKPGEVEGKPVRVQFTIPIFFRLT